MILVQIQNSCFNILSSSYEAAQNYVEIVCSFPLAKFQSDLVTKLANGAARTTLLWNRCRKAIGGFPASGRQKKTTTPTIFLKRRLGWFLNDTHTFCYLAEPDFLGDNFPTPLFL